MPNYIPGEGPAPAKIMFIGESPGRDEDREGRPFVGISGLVLNNALRHIGLRRDQCYITTVVKERCTDEDGKDRSPHREEIDEYSPILDTEVADVDPSLIVTLGRTATQYFLGDVDISVVHGVPRLSRNGQLILPGYHPAAGLRNTGILGDFYRDMQQIEGTLAGTIKPVPFQPPAFKYSLVTHAQHFYGSIVAIDTEGDEDNPYCLTYCSTPDGMGYMIKASNTAALKHFAAKLALYRPIVRLHYALHDLPVLRKLGIDLIGMGLEIVDTMIDAYLLGEPQGLKDLGRRYLGQKMKSYSDMVRPYQQIAGHKYLNKLHLQDWGKAEPILVYDADGNPKVKKPRSLNSRITKILKDYGAKMEDTDLVKRWEAVEPEMRSKPEKAFGPMPKVDLNDLPEDEVLEYACKDASVTYQAGDKLLIKICQATLTRVRDLDMGIIPILDRMQTVGLPVSVEHFDGLSDVLEHDEAELGERINEYAGRVISPASGDQVADLLFDRLKLPSGKMTKSGIRASTGDKILEGISHLHPVVKLITDWREVNKLKNTFVKAIRTFVRNGRIHPRLKMTRVATGRLSAADPNVLAFPVRTKLGKQIRAGFIAPPGYVWGTWDLSQIEVRVLAHVSEDTRLINLFWSGRDIYTEIAADFFRIPYEKVDKAKHRQPVKSMVLGVMYGIGAKKLSQELKAVGLDYTEQQCEDFIKAFFALYPGVKIWVDQQHAFVRKHGYVQTAAGRRRDLGGIFSPNKWERLEALRQAQNTPIQGGAADLIKQAMIDLWGVLNDLWRSGIDIEPLLQIHDEMLFLFKPEDWALVDAVISDAMVNVKNFDGLKYSVPLVVGSAMAPSWGELEK